MFPDVSRDSARSDKGFSKTVVRCSILVPYFSTWSDFTMDVRSVTVFPITVTLYMITEIL